MANLRVMLQVPAAIFSVLLMATGIAKLLRPNDTAGAMRQLGFPVPVVAVYALAVAEVVVGGLVLVAMHPVALAAQAFLYLGFGVWVALALRSGAVIASCGCLGRPDTPPTAGHLIVNGLGFVVSLGAITSSQSWLAGPAAETVASAVIVLVGSWLAWSILGEGARVAGLVRE